MNRTFVVVLAGALFGLIGLDRRLASPPAAQQPAPRLGAAGHARPPVLWAAGGVVLASALSDRERR